MARPGAQTSGAQDFRAIAERLAPELIEDLDKEHQREVQALYQEELDLRNELTRIVDLMQREILPREKTMHDMIEKMHQAHEAATRQLHMQVTEHLAKGFGDHNAKREQLVEPMDAMERELARIAELLGHQVVTPDIQGWQPRGQPQQGVAAGRGVSAGGYGSSPSGLRGGASPSAVQRSMVQTVSPSAASPGSVQRSMVQTSSPSAASPGSLRRQF